MWLGKIIWWLILMFYWDKIAAFNKILQVRRPTLNEIMGQFFKSCYSDRLNPIVITTNLIDIIDELRVEDIKFPVMTIDRDFKAKNVQIFIPAYPLYIVSTDSTDQLQGLLNELKSTPTWNIVSIFFFIEAEGNYCQNASQVLQLFWKFDLLSSFYFCIEPNDEIMLYTYNPYTNRAPDSWTEVNTNDKPNSRWTLYKQLYILNDRGVCQSLSYDKTKVLDGYEVKAASDTMSWKHITRNETYNMSSFEETLTNCDKMFMVSLFTALNVTPRIIYDDLVIYMNNTVHGFIKFINDASHDMSVTSRNRARFVGIVDRLNLHYQNGYFILTQYKPFEIPAEEIVDFYDLRRAAALFLGVLVVTFTTISLNTDYDYAQATLDILRMVLGAGILTQLQRLSMKICYLTSFLIIFFINPAIQGKISSYLSTPDQRNIESLKDVYDQKYNLYFPLFYVPYIFDLNLWSTPSDSKVLHPIHTAVLGCSEFVVNDSSAACFSFSEFQIADALKYKLHVTTTFEVKFYMTFFVRKNWPLKNRLDQIALKMTEAGLLDHWDKKSLHWPIKRLKGYDSTSFSTEFDQFELENMLFAYRFLLLTTTLAFILFGFEILLKKIRSRRRLRLHQRIVIFNRRVHVINEWV